MRKIAVVTGSRAEYGMLYWLMKDIQNDPELELLVIVTGMHLSTEFGVTYRQIEHDGFTIHKKVEMLLASDSPVGVSNSIGLGVIGCANAFAELQPDMVVLLGDRFETLAAAVAAMVARIPIAHLHGGESTIGVMDEAIRHSITKMSHLHFVAAEAYRERVIQLGEDPEKVFNVGAIGLDHINKLSLLSRQHVEEKLNFTFGKHTLLVTFHPVTLENNTASEQFGNLLTALSALPETNIIFTKANADMGGRLINAMIDDYVEKHPEHACGYMSLGQLTYLSAMQFVDAVVGNSSSGIIEAPSFHIGTINIGDRQAGRLKTASVIDCEPTVQEITRAFQTLYSPSFQAHLKKITNPYGDGATSGKITTIMKEAELKDILKKRFFDIRHNILC